jgi:hypothetical protein
MATAVVAFFFSFPFFTGHLPVDEKAHITKSTQAHLVDS